MAEHNQRSVGNYYTDHFLVVVGVLGIPDKSLGRDCMVADSLAVEADSDTFRLQEEDDHNTAVGAVQGKEPVRKVPSFLEAGPFLPSFHLKIRLAQALHYR